jgi:3-hydroxymyristoyl/3-hydroxydecanoyl-(acyl carrier protein) dehydratase
LNNQWSLLREVKETNNNHIEALADVPAESPWFLGHFPGEPILPGIALVHVVKEAINQNALNKGEEFQFHGLKRVRFTQPVRPGDRLSVNINAEDTGKEILFHFKVACKKNVVSSGIIAAKKIKD